MPLGQETPLGISWGWTPGQRGLFYPPAECGEWLDYSCVERELDLHVKQPSPHFQDSSGGSLATPISPQARTALPQDRCTGLL